MNDFQDPKVRGIFSWVYASSQADTVKYTFDFSLFLSLGYMMTIILQFRQVNLRLDVLRFAG